MSLGKKPQCHPSNWWWPDSSWHLSDIARRLKFGTNVANHISRTIMRSMMTHVLHVSCQEPSISPKSLNMMLGSWHTSNHARRLKFGTQIGNQISRTIMRSMMTHVLHVSGQEPSISSMSLMMIGVVLDTLLIILECWHLAHRPEIKNKEQLWGQRWSLSSMSLIRNHQCPPSHSWWWGDYWHTSNDARML